MPRALQPDVPIRRRLDLGPSILLFPTTLLGFLSDDMAKSLRACPQDPQPVLATVRVLRQPHQFS